MKNFIKQFNEVELFFLALAYQSILIFAPLSLALRPIAPSLYLIYLYVGGVIGGIGFVWYVGKFFNQLIEELISSFQ